MANQLQYVILGSVPAAGEPAHAPDGAYRKLNDVPRGTKCPLEANKLWVLLRDYGCFSADPMRGGGARPGVCSCTPAVARGKLQRPTLEQPGDKNRFRTNDSGARAVGGRARWLWARLQRGSLGAPCGAGTKISRRLARRLLKLQGASLELSNPPPKKIDSPLKRSKPSQLAGRTQA